MKTLKLSALALISFLSVTFSSCNDKDETPLGITNPAASSIAAQLSTYPDFSILKQALVKTDLLTTLENAGEYTIFAPNNTGITAFLTANSYANIDAVPTAALKQILLYHVMSGRKSSDNIDMPNNYYNTLALHPSTGNPLSLYVGRSSSAANPKINGVSTVINQSSQPNINASNGIIIAVDKVITFQTVVSLLSLNTNLSQLVGLATSGTQADVVAALSATTNKTIFAPTNAAFTAALAPAAGTVPAGFLNGNVTQPNVNSVLKYHVIDGNKDASMLTDNLIVNTFLTIPAQKTFKIMKGSDGSVKIIDTSNLPTKSANVTKANVQATDGMIHVIDKVLNPFL